MSPLIVSQILPPDLPYFEVVVFDEASQVRRAEALPAFLRGRQLVVDKVAFLSPLRNHLQLTNERPLGAADRNRLLDEERLGDSKLGPKRSL